MRSWIGWTLATMIWASHACAIEPIERLELPATAIFSKGPNDFHGDELHIRVGRGAILGWYVQAEREERVNVLIEYSCDLPLDQEYQLSVDGQDRFWEVPSTDANQWAFMEIGEFDLRAGIPLLIQLVPPSGRKYEHPMRFRRLLLESGIQNNLRLVKQLEEPALPDTSPGFGQKLELIHPSLESRDLRVDGELWRISGMAMRGQNELLFTTWEGDLFAIDLDKLPWEGPPSYRRIAQGLSEPMGLAVQGNRIFVTEKNEATELIDEDGDGRFETYRCISHAWPCTLDYHEYLFGAVVQESYLYFSSSVAMSIRGTHNRQAPMRGSVVKVHIETGETEFVAGGLRTPDGIGVGPRDSILITDNQGEWLPGNKLIHLAKDAFYQFRSRAPWHPLDRPDETPPAVWLPQGEIAASPTQPILVPDSWGPYGGQVLFGDATFGGLQRAFLEEVEGVVQGVAFPFSQGFRHLFHRFQYDPAGVLYAGGIARGSDWEFIERVSGLTQIRFNGRPVFEPLAVRIFTNGLEVEFTQPLAEGIGWDPNGYYVTQWGYQGTQTYGGSKIRHRRAEVRSASVSADRRRVFLELGGMVEGEVIYLRLPESMTSWQKESLWVGEMWYTANRIPRGKSGPIRVSPESSGATPTSYFQFSKGNEGRALYRAYCAACHSLDGTRLVGPSFVELADSKRLVRDEPDAAVYEVIADRKYLRQSITEPNAQLVDGYPSNLMPPIGGMLAEKQLEQLIDYIVRVSKPEVAKSELAIRPRTIREWKMSDFTELAERVSTKKLDAGAMTRGLQAFMKAKCLQCHKLSNFGMELGPDLVESVRRFQGKKLLQQIVEPSMEIHAKYQSMQFLLQDGSVVTGMVTGEDDTTYRVLTNLLEPSSMKTVKKVDIESQQPAKTSAMPEGLLNVLTKAEIVDLLLFLENGGQMPSTHNPPKAKK